MKKLPPERWRAIGRRLRDIRLQRQIALNKLAQAVEISETHLSNIERGVRTTSLDIIVTLAEMLDVSMDYLIFGCIMKQEIGGLILRSDEELSERYRMED